MQAAPDNSRMWRTALNPSWTQNCTLADTIGALQFIARDVADAKTDPRWCYAMDAKRDIISGAWIPHF